MPATPGETAIGWVGTGVMGCHMALHVLHAGFKPMTVFNRTVSKTKPLVDAGAKLAGSIKEVAGCSDVVFTMVGYPSDVREAILGSDGLMENLQRGSIIVDLTTSEPGLAAELSAIATSQGKHVIDAPVTGGDVGAKKGILSTMVGGNSDVVEHVRPILECFSKTITAFNAPGLGQHCKLANQITIASAMIGVCEGLLYAHAAGLDLESYLSAIVNGAAGSFSIKVLAPRILKGDLDPGFYVEHFVKDLGIALESCKQMNISLPGLGLAQQLYVSLVAHGDGRLGIQALIRTLERLNNKQLPQKSTFTSW